MVSTVHVYLCDVMWCIYFSLHLLLLVYCLLLHCSYVINMVDTLMCNYDYEG